MVRQIYLYKNITGGKEKNSRMIGEWMRAGREKEERSDHVAGITEWFWAKTEVPSQV